MYVVFPIPVSDARFLVLDEPLGTGSIEPTAGFAIQLLPDRQVLAAGGSAFSNGGSTQAELFTPTEVPGAPLAVSAAAANGSAFVTFAPPLSDGGLTIEQYTIRASSGQTVTTPDGRTFATIAGLTNGKPVTFTVTADNALGTGPASAPSNTVIPAAPKRDTAPRLRIFGLARRMSVARLLSGVEFAVKPSKAVRLQIRLLAHARQATIARAMNVTLATDKAGSRTTASRWITIVGSPGSRGPAASGPPGSTQSSEAERDGRLSGRPPA